MSYLLLGILIRTGLLIWGEFQDRLFEVKYTDIDYTVFTDAARHVIHYDSPYNKITYRYTPVLAYLMVPNVLLFNAFGKLLFILADILSAQLVLKLTNDRLAYLLALLNPISINVCTRGNSDSLVSFLLLSVLHLLSQKRLNLLALLLGFSIHLRIFPVILLPSLFLNISHHFSSTEAFRVLVLVPATFLVLGLLFFSLYGEQFIYSSYLYHLSRADHRHNLSLFFYTTYLTPESEFTKIAAFLPQLALQLGISLKFYKQYPFCMFLQIYSFVVFNKVYTVQYFVWFLCLVPLFYRQLDLTTSQGLTLLSLASIALLTWLFFAYKLEFLGENVFLELWLCSCLLFVTNIVILSILILRFNTFLA